MILRISRISSAIPKSWQERNLDWGQAWYRVCAGISISAQSLKQLQWFVAGSQTLKDADHETLSVGGAMFAMKP